MSVHSAIVRLAEVAGINRSHIKEITDELAEPEVLTEPDEKETPDGQ